ncbi:hypothetical protein QUF84_18275 [Fictibacillus enclensis]|uniref:hypothetical protein n=1 Tax=Fictibacillus enclensis TaxID=1017270 RepID=UPI0025A0F060|nr:hypothetical protein [Fictibacillus enclensis]MDM5339150.1 hypothetical protein [Fictibacillus enclensis]
MLKGHSYAESHDEGETWNYDSEGLEEHPYLYNMVIHPDDPDEKLVAAAASPSTGHHASLFSTIYRKNGDEKWEELSDGLDCEGAYLAALASDPNDPGSYYAFNNIGLYQLNAGKHRWSKMPVKWETDFNDQHPSFLIIQTS